jgi:hypothetical protein
VEGNNHSKLYVTRKRNRSGKTQPNNGLPSIGWSVLFGFFWNPAGRLLKDHHRAMEAGNTRSERMPDHR